jgi:hypothetical protein
MGRSLPADEPAANGDSGGRWQSHKDVVYFIPLTECRLDHLPSALCGQIEDYRTVQRVVVALLIQEFNACQTHSIILQSMTVDHLWPNLYRILSNSKPSS